MKAPLEIGRKVQALRLEKGWSIKPLAEQGHYTGVHDAVFDRIMPKCPPSAWKVLCLVIRKTRGWKKDWDAISYAQIRKGTGIKSDETISKALDWLTDKKLLLCVEGEKWNANTYCLNKDFELPPATENEVEPATEIVDTRTTEQETTPPTEGSDEPQKDRVALLVRRCEEVSFHPTPKQKQTWGNELGAKSRRNLADPEFMRLVVLVSKAAGEGYFWSLSKAERELGKPRGKTSIGPVEPVDEASDEEKANPYDLRAYLDRKKRRAS